jgi:hypothetical protein
VLAVQADTDESEIARLRGQIRKAGRALVLANKRREDVMIRLTACVQAAAELGVPETQLAELAGVDRMTVRRMLGKR